MKKTVAVIGLNAFGMSLAEELTKLGATVIAIDKDEKLVSKIADVVDQSAIADTTNLHVLEDLGIKHVDQVVISISGNIESSIMTTLLVHELGVKEILVKVESEYHALVAEKLGATETISPDHITAKRVAKKMVSKNVLDYFNIIDDYGIYEIQVGENVSQKPLIDLELREKFGINILIVKRNNEIFIPTGKDAFQANDIVMIMCEHKRLEKFQNYILDL